MPGKFYTLSGYDEERFEIELSVEEATALINAYARDLESATYDYFTLSADWSMYLSAYTDKDGYFYNQSINYNQTYDNTLDVIGTLNIAERNTLTDEEK